MHRKLFLLVALISTITLHAQTGVLNALKQTYALPEQIFQLYIHSHYDSLYAMAADIVKQQMTERTFIGQMTMTTMQLGPVKEAGMWQMTEQEDYKVYKRTLTFKALQMDLTIAVNKDQQWETLFMGNPKPLTAPPPATMPAGERTITIQADGGPQLPGRLTLPSDVQDKVPVAILVHGSGPNDMNETIGPNAPFRDLAEGLSRQGIAVILYDKRTKVAPQWYGEAGHVANYDTETVDDAVAAAQMATTIQEIDPARIFVIGHSLGAELAPRIAEKCPTVKGIILMAAPTRDLLTMVREQYAYLGVSADSMGVMLDRFKASLPQEYLAMDSSYDPVRTAKELSLPMLILQGERDYQVTMADFAAWQKALAHRKNVTLKSYPTLNHLFFTGEGKSMPAEYAKPDQHVATDVIADIARFILASH